MPTNYIPASSVTLRRDAARIAHKRDEPGAERALKPRNVCGVGYRAPTALRRARSSPHRLLRTADDAPDHPDHSSPSTSIDSLGDHDALRQKKSGAPSLAGAKRLAKHLQCLLGVARKSIGVKQKAVECSQARTRSSSRIKTRSRRICTTPPSQSRPLAPIAQTSRSTPPTTRTRNSLT